MVKKSDNADSGGGETGYSEGKEALGWDDIFHLIQDRYGWSDEAVLNLTRARMIQIAEKIQRDKVMEINLMNNMTRVVCSYIISTSMVTSEGKEAMLDKLLQKTKEEKNEAQYNSAEKMMNVFSMFGGGK